MVDGESSSNGQDAEEAEKNSQHEPIASPTRRDKTLYFTTIILLLINLGLHFFQGRTAWTFVLFGAALISGIPVVLKSIGYLSLQGIQDVYSIDPAKRQHLKLSVPILLMFVLSSFSLLGSKSSLLDTSREILSHQQPLSVRELEDLQAALEEFQGALIQEFQSSYANANREERLEALHLLEEEESAELALMLLAVVLPEEGDPDLIREIKEIAEEQAGITIELNSEEGFEDREKAVGKIEGWLEEYGEN